MNIQVDTTQEIIEESQEFVEEEEGIQEIYNEMIIDKESKISIKDILIKKDYKRVVENINGGSFEDFKLLIVLIRPPTFRRVSGAAGGSGGLKVRRGYRRRVVVPPPLLQPRVAVAGTGFPWSPGPASSV